MRGQIIPLTIVLLFLFGTVASAAPATTSQIDGAENALDNEGPKGLDKLQGKWAEKQESHQWYYRDGEGLDYARGRNCNSCGTEWLVYDPLVDAALGENPADFPWGVTTNDFLLTRIFSSLEIAPGGDSDVYVQLMDGTTPIAGAAAIHQFDGLVANSPNIPGFGYTLGLTRYQASLELDTPLLIPAGTDLGVRIWVPDPSLTDVSPTSVYYGDASGDSFVKVSGFTTGVNVWSTDNDGRVTTSFPSPQSAPSEDRHIRVWVAHVNALGNSHNPGKSPIGENTGDVGQHSSDVRIIDKDGNSRRAVDEVRVNTRTIKYLAPGIELVEFDLQYADNLKDKDGNPYDGPMTIEVFGRGQQWVESFDIAIGGADVELSLAPNESRTKTILVGETTTFLMTLKNGGLIQDDVVITGGNVGGWKIDANVDGADLGPGQSRTFPVTVTPPPGALSGDFKSLDVTAFSSLTGRSDVETVTVILTNIATHGVDVLANQLETVKLQPGETKRVGLTVKNLGNAGENFAMSTAGTPLGWKGTLSPSSLSLGAKSQAGVILSMTAPIDAKQGDKFALAVTVRSVLDNTVKDTLLIPYEIFFREEFKLSVLDGVEDGQFTSVVTKATDVDAGAYGDSGFTHAPGVHALRDEGQDGVVTSGTNRCGVVVTTTCPTVPGISNTASHWDGIGDPDNDYDQSTIFRLQLTNSGFRNDQIRLTPDWVGVGGNAYGEMLDSYECENNGGADGIPDGWRFRYWEAGKAPVPDALADRGNNPHNNPDKRLPLDMVSLVSLPAGETKFIWVEMGWEEVARLDGSDSGSATSCQGTDQGSGDGTRESPATKNAVVRFFAESMNDLTKTQDLYIRAHYNRNVNMAPQGSDLYGESVHEVLLGIDPATYTNPQGRDASEALKATGSETARTAIYHLRAVNAGNEKDTVRIEVPADADNFAYKIVLPPSYQEQVTINRQSHLPANTRESAIGCSTVSAGKVMDCIMGSFDEFPFQVHVTAADGKLPIGLLHKFNVRATSLDSLAASGTTAPVDVELSTRVTGTYAFNIAKPVVANNGIYDVNVVAGKSVKVPFTIANIGTSFDDYAVDLPEAPSQASGWDGIFSFNSPQFIAGGKDHNGFLTITAPAGAPNDSSQTFRVRVASLNGDIPERTLRIQATVVAPTVGLEVVPDPAEVIAIPGGEAEVTFKATRTSGIATGVTFALRTSDLPDGWGVDDATPARVSYGTGTQASQKFVLSIPSDAIGSSRVPVTVVATDSANRVTTAQAVVSLSSGLTGVHLSTPTDFEAQEITSNIVAGSSTQVELRVQNLGADIDQIGLDTEPLAPGWSVSFTEGRPEAASFQPFEARTVIMTVHAPDGVPAGQGVDIIVKATSASDETSTDSLFVKMRTGQSLLEVSTPVSPTRYLAPFETTTFSYTVRNNGTVRDEVTFTAGLSVAYQDLLTVKFDPAKANLGPGESATVAATVTVPEGFLKNSVIPIKLQATSDGPFLNAFGESSVELRVLDHRVYDIDADGNMEYAVDRDRDASNGFEQFIDPVTTGKISQSVKMVEFLTKAAIVDWTVIVTENNVSFERFNWIFDLTGDGRIDHFIDVNQDNLPDIFWNPSTGARDDLDATYDVTQDGVREYFVDVDGDNQLDIWYDITTGKVGRLLKVDVDGDGIIDFVVDLDGDGQHDSGEPVLFGKNGKITKITQSIDINGDGKLDLVVDEDGDGVPDYFVPSGKTRGVKIVLEDVTSDGVEDWTYDANNDGRRDSYYNPVTGETGSIDTNSQFVDGLAKYWYVPTLFALVTVLFVVLVVVTRR